MTTGMKTFSFLLLTHQFCFTFDSSVLPLYRPRWGWCENAMGTLMFGNVEGTLCGQTGAGGWAGGQAGWVDEAGEKNAPMTWCFGTVELLWGWYRKPVLFGAEEGGVPPWRERMTEQRDTFWSTVSQPVCPALSGVNMEGWRGGDGHEECVEGGGKRGVLCCRTRMLILPSIIKSKNYKITYSCFIRALCWV